MAPDTSLLLRAAQAAAVSVACVALLASCGGGGSADPGGGSDLLSGDPPATDDPATAPVETYLRKLPKWADYSPKRPRADKPVGTPKQSDESVEIPIVVGTGVDERVIGYRSEDYTCTTTKFRLTDTPEKIVMLSPDREIMWPGAMIQGFSHRHGLGSLLPLVVRERAPIKVSIPSLATSDNFRLVGAPDQAEVNQAIGSMIANANTGQLTAPSSIQFTMHDYASEESFALKAGMSGRYMGFSASASASVATSANEHTVMVQFVEKMFEVVVEPPQTPGAFFSAAFTRDKLDEQIAMGRIGPDNPPVYVSNVVYGRLMTFAFTSTASASEIKAALSAAYSGMFGSVKATLSVEHENILKKGRIVITSLGGSAVATLDMIRSGDWRDYFARGPAPLTTAYPLSYTLRNLGDGSIAEVSETTDYDVRQCNSVEGFVVDSFEVDFGTVAPATDEGKKWIPTKGSSLTVSWGAPTSPQSIFYGHLYAKHANKTMDRKFLYDVGYLHAPAHFHGDKSEFYKGALSFWFKPDESLYVDGTVCIGELLCFDFPDKVHPLGATHQVLAYDQVTTFDQVVLRGGGVTEPTTITLTFNPREEDSKLPAGWSRREFKLTNDQTADTTRCTRKDSQSPWRNCWLVHDQPATEHEIAYALANVTELRIRASYPTQLNVAPAGSAADWRPWGYVGGYFDEVQLNKRVMNP